jgi:hypothetical protein
MSTITEDIGRRRHLYRLALARHDLQAARRIAALAVEQASEMSEGNDLWIPLQEALVVAYARPFSSNKPFGPLASAWGKFDDPQHQRLHRELLQMRDRLVAHSDASELTVIIFPPRVRWPVGDREPSDRATMAIFHRRPGPSYFSAVAELCEDLATRLHAAVETELQALFGEIDAVSPFDLLTGAEHTPKPGLVLSVEDAPKPR